MGGFVLVLSPIPGSWEMSQRSCLLVGREAPGPREQFWVCLGPSLKSQGCGRPDGALPLVAQWQCPPEAALCSLGGSLSPSIQSPSRPSLMLTCEGWP